MVKYAGTGQEPAVTSALQSMNSIIRGAGVRAKLYEFTLSTGGVPEDTTVRWTVDRFTVAPSSGTALTSTPLDPDHPASVTTMLQAATIEGTHTADTEMFDAAFNVRAAYRWVAAPGGELISPNVAANGISIRVIQGSATYAGIADASLFFEE